MFSIKLFHKGIKPKKNIMLKMTREKLSGGMSANRNTDLTESISDLPVAKSRSLCSGYLQGLGEEQGPHGQEVALAPVAGQGWERCPAASGSGTGLSLWYPHLGDASSARACTHWQPSYWNPFVHPDLRQVRKQPWRGDPTSGCSCTAALFSSMWAQWVESRW